MSRQKFPNFSVLMSVYKNEKSTYLNASLKSIENQTVVPDEIILVEDGPLTKELYEVIDTHRNMFGEGFKVVVLNKNQGLGNALRIGTKYISTNWIARMDTDDIAVPNRFELQLREIEKNPQLAVIGGQVDEFEGSVDNIIGKRTVPCSQVDIYKFIKWRSPFNHLTVLINRALLEKVGGYKYYGKLEDYYLWSRIISSKYCVKNIDKVVVHMRVDSGMYKRRGDFNDIKYIIKLKKFLKNRGVITGYEEIEGIGIMIINNIIPSWVRKVIYRKALHNVGRK